MRASRRDVTETLFAVEVMDMNRANAFHGDALDATVASSSPGWSSLQIAGVRIGLALSGRIGLHLAVSDFAAARVIIEWAGGRTEEAVEVAPAVIVADATDTEGNVLTFALQRSS
jgi:predicted enzyme related to lactoylglutathione lyase